MPSVAAVDVGSNAIRLSLVEVSPTGRELSNAYHRYPLRLGTDVFARGEISRESADELMRIFREIAERLRDGKVEHYRAVATSAMRDAGNGGALASRIEAETGVRLEILSGKAESRLSRNALVRSLGFVSAETLLVDLGGGSLEIEYARSHVGRSLPFGTVRLLERFPQLKAPLRLHALREIQKTLLRDMERRFPRRRKVGLALGTGGSFDVLARFAPHAGGFWPAIDLDALQTFVEGLARLTVEERQELLDVRSDRADLVLPAALVILTLRRLFHLRAFVVPRTGLRDALLRDLVSAPRVAQQARQVLRRLHGDVVSASRRAMLSRSLFGALSPLHRLWVPALGVLEAAAYLADVGDAISPAGASQHAGYILRHASGLDLDERCRDVAAYAVAVAAGDPLPDFTAGLRPDDLPSARILGAILHVADQLTRLKARRTARVDLMSTPIAIDLGLGRALDSRRVALLERVLGQKIRVS